MRLRSTVDVDPLSVVSVLERHSPTAPRRGVRRDFNRGRIVRDLRKVRLYNELCAAAHSADLVAAPARKRHGVGAARTRNVPRGRDAGIGHVPALLRAVSADLGPCPVPVVFEGHGAGIIAELTRDRQRDGRTRSGDLARDERCAAAVGRTSTPAAGRTPVSVTLYEPP